MQRPSVKQRDSRLKLLREMQRDYEGYNNSVKQVLLAGAKAAAAAACTAWWPT